jgi:hypothetical protein
MTRERQKDDLCNKPEVKPNPFDVIAREQFPGISAKGRAAQAWGQHLPAHDSFAIVHLMCARYRLLRLLRRRRRALLKAGKR